MPTHTALETDEEILDDEVIAGFLEQTKVATPAPTAAPCPWYMDHYLRHLEQAYTGIRTDAALSDANEELLSLIDNLQRAQAIAPKHWISNNSSKFHCRVRD